tara:strand:- start:7994 stop:8278 length:285 start_codon:yes stop_codon:yes gene_type:complete
MNSIKYIVVTLIFILTSCVSQKKYTSLQDSLQLCESRFNNSKSENSILEVNLANEINRAKSLEQQMEYFKSTNTDLLARLSDLSVVSKSGGREY